MTAEHFARVKAARIAFEARWQPSSIAVVDSGFYERFMDQKALWDEAYAVGAPDEIETQSGGMIRAYEAATKLLEGHRMTAFLIGHDHDSSRTICVSAHSESVEHAKKHTEYPVTWVTPEAVARLVGQATIMGITIEDREDRLS